MNEDSDDETVSLSDHRDVEAATAISVAYRVLGELSDPGGAIGVLGRNTAGSGTTKGVEGRVDSPSGYGLYTPDDASVGGVVETDFLSTAGDDFTLEAGDTSTEHAQNIVAGHSGNTALANGAVIAGGGFDDGSTDDVNEAVGSFPTVSGGRHNKITGTGADYTTIGGGRNNTIPDDGLGSTIGGGRGNAVETDRASDVVIGGGVGNTAREKSVTIGGGSNNTATSGAKYATVGGGTGNTVKDTYATVGGGVTNIASGLGATVPGGADGWAADDDTFVWNDRSKYHLFDDNLTVDGLSSSKDIAGSGVTGSNTFHASAQGGFRFITGSSNVTYIPSGSTGWSTTSSRAVKTNVEPVDPQAVLDGVETMAVTTWEYEGDDGQGQGVRHIGPMAEAFHDAFDVGATDTGISSINADGVALAAIQGLAERLAERDDHVAELQTENEQLRERNDHLQARLDDIETRVATLESSRQHQTPASDDEGAIPDGRQQDADAPDFSGTCRVGGGMDVTIREATPEDVPTLTILRQQALEAAYRDTYDATEVADIVARVGDLRTRITDEAWAVLLVETEVTAVGYGAVSAESGELAALYTSPDYQREGFASELLARLEQRVPDDTTVEGAVPEHAAGFFEREGYDVREDTRWHDLPAVAVRKPS